MTQQNADKKLCNFAVAMEKVRKQSHRFHQKLSVVAVELIIRTTMATASQGRFSIPATSREISPLFAFRFFSLRIENPKAHDVDATWLMSLLCNHFPVCLPQVRNTQAAVIRTVTTFKLVMLCAKNNVNLQLRLMVTGTKVWRKSRTKLQVLFQKSLFLVNAFTLEIVGLSWNNGLS